MAVGTTISTIAILLGISLMVYTKAKKQSFRDTIEEIRDIFTGFSPRKPEVEEIKQVLQPI